jgi:Amiloride-sensitive sodium channel
MFHPVTTGLRLILNVKQSDYAALSTCDTAGVRMVVLDQNKMPFPEDIGLNINPGMYTVIGLKKVCAQPYVENGNDLFIAYIDITVGRLALYSLKNLFTS